VRLDDLGVDQGEDDGGVALAVVVLRDVDDDEAAGDADLGRGEADAGGGDHRLVHVGGEPAQAIVDAADLGGFLAEAGVALQHDVEDGHRFPIREARCARLGADGGSIAHGGRALKAARSGRGERAPPGSGRRRR
jgi:hypothetical protein